MGLILCHFLLCQCLLNLSLSFHPVYKFYSFLKLRNSLSFPPPLRSSHSAGKRNKLELNRKLSPFHTTGL
ncbi:hypothetical protein GDO81_014281 [Engystomops pustulosus]|uniref:Uncharacterized protein n=1 Tax=Engystomops pustulosus TaxID=76066 RepID=A0AAV7B9S1_ENGPU|nr:hypothetical protein GDO81_014281 [Engystomops pustulosus]